jgi:hypothetical protein
MTSISLHPTPSLRTVATEQLRAVGRALRTEALFFVGALVLLGVLVIANAVRMVHVQQLHPGTNLHMGMTYGSTGAIPIFLMAFLIPFGVWRAEDPSRRAYHWSMPVARGPHTIVKLLSGWLWMMIASAVYLLFIIVLATVVPLITGEPNHLGNTPAWEWIVGFTAPTLAYMLTSIAVIGSNHAWRWIGGLFVGYWVLIGFLAAFGMHDAAQVLRTVSDGAYGLNAALFGTADHTRGQITVGISRAHMDGLSVSNWLIAMPLWIIGSGIAVTIASYRHRE